MKKEYKITTKSGKVHTVTYHDDIDELAAVLESLRGARAVTVHANHECVLGKDIKKTKPVLDENGEVVLVNKLFGYNGLTNVNYGNCVRNYLRKHGESLVEAGEKEAGEFLIAESKVWKPKTRVWGTHKDGLRHVVEHTNKDGEHKVYVTVLTWRKEGSLYHRWETKDGKVLGADEIAPHLYAKSSSKPTVELSDGSRIDIPFYVRTITLDKVADVKGIELAETNLSELAEIIS